MKTFSVYQHGGAVAGLYKIEQTNASLNMLIPNQSLDNLEIEHGTWAVDKNGERYYIVRET